MTVQRRPAHTDDISVRLHRVQATGVHMTGDSELVRAQRWWPAAETAPGPRRGEPSHPAVTNQVAFKLSESAEQVEHEFPASEHTTTELAELFNIGRSTIYRALQRNQRPT